MVFCIVFLQFALRTCAELLNRSLQISGINIPQRAAPTTQQRVLRLQHDGEPTKAFALGDGAYDRMMAELQAGKRYVFSYYGACPHHNPTKRESAAASSSHYLAQRLAALAAWPARARAPVSCVRRVRRSAGSIPVAFQIMCNYACNLPLYITCFLLKPSNPGSCDPPAAALFPLRGGFFPFLVTPTAALYGVGVHLIYSPLVTSASPLPLPLLPPPSVLSWRTSSYLLLRTTALQALVLYGGSALRGALTFQPQFG
eukprot:COSAG01_NODE_12178_length_1785_cov_486.796560_1_plen_257_part_00